MEVIHHAEDQQFELQVEGHSCICAYRLQDGLMLMTHTEVPPALEGRGLAALLVGAALDWARSQGLRVRPLCSYVRVYMRRHPEVQDLLAQP